MSAGEPRLEGAALAAHPIAAAVIEVVRERGFEDASGAEIARRAGISEAEFDRRFAGKGEAALRVFEAYIADFRGRVAAAYEAGGRWPASLRAAGYEAIRWMDHHPDAAWFGMVGMLEGGEMALVRREELFRWCGGLIEAGREVAPDPGAVPAQASVMAVGAVVETLRRQSEGSMGGGMAETVPRLMYGAVRPYLGEEAAQAELAIPPPADLIERERSEPGRGSGESAA